MSCSYKNTTDRSLIKHNNPTRSSIEIQMRPAPKKNIYIYLFIRSAQNQITKPDDKYQSELDLQQNYKKHQTRPSPFSFG